MAKVPTAADADRTSKQLALLCAGLAATWIVLTICLWNDAFFEGKELSDPSLLVRLFLGFHPPKAYMPLRLVTYSLMHTPWMLLGNLILLALVYRLGREVLGPGTFVRVYSLTTVVGGLAYLLLSRLASNSVPYIGALPALMGTVGFLIVLNPGRDVSAREALVFLSPLLPLWSVFSAAELEGVFGALSGALLGAVFGAASAGVLVGMVYGFLEKWWRERSARRSAALSDPGGLIIVALVLASLAAVSLGLYKEQEQLGQVIDTLRSGTERERGAAARELGRTGEWTTHVVQGLIAALDDPAQGVQEAAGNALLKVAARRPAIPAYDGLDAFAALLEHEPIETRILGARCLGLFGAGAKPVAQALIRSAATDVPEVRWAAVEALNRVPMTRQEKLSLYTQATADEDPRVHRFGARRLAALSSGN